MYYVADRQKAVRILTELRSTRLDQPAETLLCLQRLRNDVAGESQHDEARIAAWIAIRNLYDAFKANPGRDLKPLWHTAITKTVEWNESLR